MKNDAEIIEAATEGPWASYPCSGSVHAPQHLLVLGPLDCFPPSLSIQLRANDAAFIAAARTRWPAAIAEIAELRGRVEVLEGLLKEVARFDERSVGLTPRDRVAKFLEIVDRIRTALATPSTTGEE